MTERGLLEIIAVQIARITNDVDEIKITMAIKQELARVKAGIISLKDIVVRIENNHGQKLGALPNGYKLMSERLDRVEKKVEALTPPPKMTKRGAFIAITVH